MAQTIPSDIIQPEISIAETEYTTRLDNAQREFFSRQQWDLQLFQCRVGLGILLVVLTYFSLFAQTLAFNWLLLASGIFIVFIIVHQRVRRQLKRQQRIMDYYQRCVNRCQGKWQNQGLTGEHYLDKEHNYTADLDIFGKNSLFQLLCQARTSLGQQRLADWLAQAANREDILLRQQAVTELKPKLDSREALAELEDSSDVPEQTQLHLLQWSKKPLIGISRLIRAVALLSSLATTAALIAYFIGASHLWLVLCIAVQLLLLYSQKDAIMEVAKEMDALSQGLNILSKTLACLENESFQSEKLQNIRQSLDIEGLPASARIKQLDTLINCFNHSLRNQLMIPVAIVFCLPLHFVYAISRWQQRGSGSIKKWLCAVADYEALNSFACFAYEHPESTFATISTQQGQFMAEQLRHPLIARDVCVANDLAMLDGHQLMMVSGSNMSGKSTLLRAIGTNMVLAFAGAPVQANKMTLSLYQLGTVMRMQDSLADGASYFYAVIHRLKHIVDLADRSPTLFFLFDEILQGTNSHDRLVGAQEIITQLVGKQAMGLVTTHDLALTKIVDTLAGKASNIHFQDQLVDDKMEFDYKIKNGVVTHSNALILLKMMGLSGDSIRSDPINDHLSP